MSASIPGKRTYRAKRGDTLWGIAKSQYGDGLLWASIAKENNLPSPDVLFVGHELVLSQRPVTARATIPISPNLSRSVAKTVTMPTYDFEFPVFEHPTAIFVGPIKVTIKLEGKLTFQKPGTVSGVSVKNLKEIQVNSKKEITNHIQTLISETKFIFDPEKRTLKAKGGLGSILKLHGGAELKNEMNCDGKKTTFTAQVSKVTGTYKGWGIEGNFGFEISFECEDFTTVSPARVSLPNVRIDWNKVAEITLVAVGMAIVLVLVAKVLPWVFSGAVVTAILAIPFLTAWQMLNKRVPVAGRLL